MLRRHQLAGGIVAVLAAAIGARTLRADEPKPSSGPTAVAAPRPDDGKVRIIAFGAHPDDAEYKAGGCAILWSALGHKVELVSVTNGDVGHWKYSGPELAARRAGEVAAVSKVFGSTSLVMDNHDGELMPTLENRRAITRLIRKWNADVVIGHRPNDYHPDHRYTGVLMQDAAYMVTVPYFCPDTPYLTQNPVFLYCYDIFQRPNPFRPDIVVSIDAVIEKKLDAVLNLESQLIEGGATGYDQPWPKDAAERQARAQKVREDVRQWFGGVANRYRAKLIEVYGEEEGKKVRCAEAFEICEYGRQPTPAEIKRLFPFLPK